MDKAYIVSVLKKELDQLSPKTTPKVRAISQKHYPHIKDLPLDKLFELCEAFLEERRWDLGVIAYDFAYRKRKLYSLDTFKVFESWLFKYINDWGNCDDFTTHAFGYLIHDYPELSYQIVEWTKHEKFAVRRAAATVLIVPIKKHNQKIISPFVISDLLMHDDHYLVLKGYGWMLKIYLSTHQEDVIQYLKKNRDHIPSISFRYAIEKLSKDEKKKYFNL
jgi:3-methyladenine DNA glycosylase AlkD